VDPFQVQIDIRRQILVVRRFLISCRWLYLSNPWLNCSKLISCSYIFILKHVIMFCLLLVLSHSFILLIHLSLHLFLSSFRLVYFTLPIIIVISIIHSILKLVFLQLLLFPSKHEVCLPYQHCLVITSS
jgi:hypothetical protein